jgi:uncharacterized membrane protein
VAAKYILGALSVVFLCLGGTRLARDAGRLGPASKTWLLIGVIFAAVSVWLWRSA